MHQLQEQILGQLVIDDARQLELVYLSSVRDVRFLRHVHKVEAYDVRDVGGVEGGLFVPEYLPDSLDRVRVEFGVALLMRGPDVRPWQTGMQGGVDAGAERHSIDGQQNLPYSAILYNVQNIFPCGIVKILDSLPGKLKGKGKKSAAGKEERTGEAAEHEILRQSDDR